MASEFSVRPWLIASVAIAAIALYAYMTVEIRAVPGRSRPEGTAADIAALADRDDTNIIFILIDTLRAERMSAYGYERETTPFLDELASTGIRFRHHIAQSSWTKSSMASLWTALNPIRAGVTKFNHAVSPEVEMPAEILARAGFKNVGVYRNGWVHGYFGFDQGFEKYYRPLGSRVKAAVRRERPNAHAYGSDEHLLQDAVEFLRIHGASSRWFLYLHLMDLHEYTYDDESALFGSTISDLYDNSLRRTDWVVSTLYDHLGERGLLDETIVVILSDHGEAFGERGFEGHAREVFPETTETPLIISLPVAIPGGVVVDQRTANVDVWPTLLDLIGLYEAPDGRGSDGRSRRDAILAAATGRAVPAEAEDVSVAYLDENWGQPGAARVHAISVLDGGYRYVAGRDHTGRRFEVLLASDGGQPGDLSAEHPEVMASLRERARREVEQTPIHATETFELDEMQLDQLRALGYELP